MDQWRVYRRSDPGADGGVTLLVWLAAMLCACRRDDEAHSQLAANANYLPAVGSAERHEFAVYGLRTITSVCTTHDSVCTRWSTPSALADLNAMTAADAAAQTWLERRDRWWHQLLNCAGPS